jgi:quercetin dioxygenase-like cupin family protein
MDITHYSRRVGINAQKYYKETLFKGDHLMIGLNCLEPGQSQPVHDHPDSDKAYVVMEGRGVFTVGSESRAAGPGEIIWVAAGVPHGVENRSEIRLVLLVSIGPPPKKD